MADVVHMNVDDDERQIAYDPKMYEKLLEEVAKEQETPKTLLVFDEAVDIDDSVYEKMKKYVEQSERYLVINRPIYTIDPQTGPVIDIKKDNK